MGWNLGIMGHGVLLLGWATDYNQKWTKRYIIYKRKHTFGPNDMSNTSFGPNDKWRCQGLVAGSRLVKVSCGPLSVSLVHHLTEWWHKAWKVDVGEGKWMTAKKKKSDGDTWKPRCRKATGKSSSVELCFTWMQSWTLCSVQQNLWTLDWTLVWFSKVQVQTEVLDWTLATLLSTAKNCSYWIQVGHSFFVMGHIS